MSWHFNIQWAAGFFDGEGCVSISKRQRGKFLEHHLSVQVGQAIRRPLDELSAIFGGGVTMDTKVGGLFYRWRVHGKKAQGFLEAILPHSMVKSEEILAALDLRAAIGTPGTRMTQEAFLKKEAAYLRWKEAKNVVALSRRIV